MARPPSTDQYLPSQGKYSSPPLLLDPVFRDSSTSPPYLPSGSYPDLPLITDELKSSIKPAGAPTKRSGGETEESERERRKKRPRQVLSCWLSFGGRRELIRPGTMCVKRKTKCDKSVPCAACVKRGDPALCVVEGVDESTPSVRIPHFRNSILGLTMGKTTTVRVERGHDLGQESYHLA